MEIFTDEVAITATAQISDAVAEQVTDTEKSKVTVTATAQIIQTKISEVTNDVTEQLTNTAIVYVTNTMTDQVTGTTTDKIITTIVVTFTYMRVPPSALKGPLFNMLLIESQPAITWLNVKRRIFSVGQMA